MSDNTQKAKDPRVIDIKRLIQGGKSTVEISTELNIKRTTLFGIAKRNNLTLNKQEHKGRKVGSYDKKPRTRRKNTKKNKQLLESPDYRRSALPKVGGNPNNISIEATGAEKFIAEQNRILEQELSSLEYKYEQHNNT